LLASALPASWGAPLLDPELDELLVEPPDPLTPLEPLDPLEPEDAPPLLVLLLLLDEEEEDDDPPDDDIAAPEEPDEEEPPEPEEEEVDPPPVDPSSPVCPSPEPALLPLQPAATARARNAPDANHPAETLRMPSSRLPIFAAGGESHDGRPPRLALAEMCVSAALCRHD
jgi:hypothetical protein